MVHRDADQRGAARRGHRPGRLGTGAGLAHRRPATFRAEFAYTLARMDRVQPALLLAMLAATIGFAVTAHSTARTLATLAAACFAAILAGSTLAWVAPSAGSPIQERTCQPPTSNGSAPAG